MQSKGLRRRIKWQLLDVLDVLINCCGFRLAIIAGSRKLVPNFECVSVEIDFNDGCDKSYIFIVSDSATVIDL